MYLWPASSSDVASMLRYLDEHGHLMHREDEKVRLADGKRHATDMGGCNWVHSEMCDETSLLG